MNLSSFYFFYVNSLAVLEGIAISFDPGYKVLGSTYPWIARKVLTDSSPQLQSSLKSLLYRVSTTLPIAGFSVDLLNITWPKYNNVSHISFRMVFSELIVSSLYFRRYANNFPSNFFFDILKPNYAIRPKRAWLSQQILPEQVIFFGPWYALFPVD